MKIGKAWQHLIKVILNIVIFSITLGVCYSVFPNDLFSLKSVLISAVVTVLFNYGYNKIILYRN